MLKISVQALQRSARSTLFTNKNISEAGGSLSPASFLRYDMTLCGDRYTVDLQIDNTYTLGSVDNRKYDIVLDPEQLR